MPVSSPHFPRKSALIAMALAFVPAPAFADTAYDRCVDRASSNAAWQSCGAAWIAREDKRLNEAWKRTYYSLPPRAKAALLTEQRAWIAYKDKSCRWQATGDFGREGQVLASPRCRAEEIGARADYLDRARPRGK